MALSTKDIYNLTKEINQYGATLYYLVEEDKLKLDEIESVLFKDSIEQVNLVFPNLISKISVEDIENSREKYKDEFTKLSCIDRIILKDGNRHQHLKEIRNLVNLERKLDYMIKDRTFNQSFNLNYTEKLLDLIEARASKSYLSIREKIKLYKTAFSLLRDENDKKLSSNIDSFYISMITG